VSDDTLRVATWNVHGFRAGVEQIERLVRAEELDVLLLQETGSRRDLREFGERLGWVVCADPRAFPRRRFQNAVALHPRLIGRVYRLPIRFHDAPFLQPRGASVAHIRDRLTLVSTHFGLDRQQRLHQALQLRRTLDGIETAVLIGGDLNAHPDDPATRTLAERCPDVWPEAGAGEGFTMPAARPTARIDYLFASPEARPTRAWIAGDATMSDHLMVVADVTLDP
jgi:endonuclease/exonuclease/phosphatase family metal-dependent hydrolase